MKLKTLFIFNAVATDLFRGVETRPRCLARSTCKAPHAATVRCTSRVRRTSGVASFRGDAGR